MQKLILTYNICGHLYTSEEMQEFVITLAQYSEFKNHNYIFDKT